MGTRSRSFLLKSILILLAFGWIAALPSPAEETQEQRDKRVEWWREAKFGLFIHWGLYAVPAGEWGGQEIKTAGEWILFGAKIPVDEYRPLIHQFNPVKYDPAEWVRTAKEAGMKYIVITSKHHDGFCLFDSKQTDYDVMSTPYGKDLLKPLAEECRKQGLKMCFYHSILDWQHTDYLPRGEDSPRPWDTRSKEGADFNRYINYMKAELTELLTNYGDIGILWFDGGWEHKADEMRSEEVVQMIRSLQPNIIINNRIGIPQDYDTPEQWIPATGFPGRDWEVCMTMNDTWGFKKNDNDWKSEEDLIRKLADIASKGGNFLLNVGPTAEGLIPQPSVDRLADIGRWMKTNSESIYETSASPFRHLSWGRCTQRPGKLYLHVFDMPKDGLLVPGLQNEVGRAYLLSDPTKTPLAVARQNEEDYLISLPESLPDPIDTVVVLEIMGDPKVDNAIRPDPDGSITLLASDATVHGKEIRYEAEQKKNCIGYWTSLEDWVSWDLHIPRPGNYTVEVTFACGKGSGGSQYTLKAGDSALVAQVKETSETPDFSDFISEQVGSIQIADASPMTFEVHPKDKPGPAVMDLRQIKLVPLEKETAAPNPLGIEGAITGSPIRGGSVDNSLKPKQPGETEKIRNIQELKMLRKKKGLKLEEVGDLEKLLSKPSSDETGVPPDKKPGKSPIEPLDLK
jgi:alpha-L-fucosidase